METVPSATTRASASNPARPPRGAHDEVKADGTPVGFRRLLLATDLSAASERAAAEAIRLAAESDGHLLVLSVIDPQRLRLPGGRFVRRMDQERATVEIGMQQVVGRARAVGVRATFLVWEGDAAEAIVDASEAEDVDVIILGSHGRGALGRIVLGSTSRRVSENANRPVMVVAG